AIDSTGFTTLYGYNADAYGSIPSMNNDGEALVLQNKSGTVMDAVGYEGGSTGGLPANWGSTTEPNATTGYTIVRANPTVDTNTYADWSTAGSNGYPQTQFMNDPAQMKVIFSEIFYDTPGTDSVEEWIELYNNSPMTVDISGWTIRDNNGTGTTYTIPQGKSIAPHTYYTIAVNSTGFNALYGYNADLYGAIPSLNNDGDTLILKNNYGTIKDAVAWEGGASAGIPTGWGSTTAPNAATGETIVRTDVTVDTDTYSDWSKLGTNGFPQTQALTYRVVFSEVFYDTPGTDSVEEWIELYNNSPITVNLSGWKIIDNNGIGASFTIPDGKTIAPGTFYTIAVNSTGFTALYGYNADLYGAIPSLNNDGDALVLQDKYSHTIDAVGWEGGASGGVPTGWGSASLPSAATGSTIVRTNKTVDTGTYSDWSTAVNNGTPQTQSQGSSGTIKVVFSEIFYDTPGTETQEEWIELHNNSAQAVDIGGWKITDNNNTGATFTIPAGQTIAAGAYYTIAINNNGFYNLYGYSPNLVGAIPALNNDGEALVLKDSSNTIKDAVGWEGGASAGLPTGWGSTTLPNAAQGYTIIRTYVGTDTDTYADWSTAPNNGNPQIQ
ncbi:MAG: lamin tail domain-containing protein, partial [Acidobacteria bacterium]|nr:lamin tail domain-containing protein [Acidobacteriota bacterium]